MRHGSHFCGVGLDLWTFRHTELGDGKMGWGGLWRGRGIGIERDRNKP